MTMRTFYQYLSTGAAGWSRLPCRGNSALDGCQSAFPDRARRRRTVAYPPFYEGTGIHVGHAAGAALGSGARRLAV